MSSMAAVKPMLDTASHGQNRARDLVEQAEAAVEVGDYRLARTLLVQAAQLAPGAEVGQQALHRGRSLGVDRAMVLGGLLGTAFYVVAWLLSL